MIFDNIFGARRSDKEFQKLTAFMLILVGTLFASVKGVDIVREIHSGTGYEAHKWAVGECKEAFKKVNFVSEGDTLTATINRRDFESCVQTAQSDFESSVNRVGYAGAALLVLGGLMAYDATYLRRRISDSTLLPPHF